VTYLAQRRAQRCGPCIKGLPVLAQTCERLALCETGANLAPRVRELCALVTGRGACAHPDGTARLVLSMLDTFPAETAAHEQGHCSML
jgi:NADH:ubiquinone oxidoreductase subunit F (NADH-binding)